MKSYIFLPLLLTLSGCFWAGTGIPIPLDAMVEGVTESVPVIADASVAKEAIVHLTLRNYHKEYTKAFKASGTSIDFSMQEISPGVYVQVISKLTSRGDVKMVAPPENPSVHPGWGVAERVLTKGIDATLWGFGIDSIVGGIKHLTDNIGNTFYGDADIDNAFNTAGGDQNFQVDNTTKCKEGLCGEDEPAEGEFDFGTCTDAPPAGLSPSGTPLWTPTCSCGSHDAGHC